MCAKCDASARLMQDFGHRIMAAFEHEDIGGGIVITFVTPKVTFQMGHGTMPQFVPDILGTAAEVIADQGWCLGDEHG